MTLSLSGALLSFGKEIQSSLFPDRWTVTPEKHPAKLEPLISQLHHLASLDNTRIRQLNLSQNPESVWTLQLENGRQWNINPYTGDILCRFERGSDFYSTVLYLHRWLLLSDTSYQTWARHIISIAATVLIIQTILGSLLWLKPRKRALKRLKFRRHSSTRANITQWHLILGALSGLLISLIAYTGIGFNWPVVGKLLEWGSISHIEPRPAHSPTTLGGIDRWSLALKNGLTSMPDAQLHRIYFPLAVNDPIALRLKNPAEFHPFSYVWLDGGNGEVLGHYDASKASRATRLWNFKYKLHIGDFAGVPIRLMWLLLSLLPTFFVISGLWLWRQSHSRKRR